MASCNSWQYLVTILAKIFPRSWQDLAKILLRYPWRVDPGFLTKSLLKQLAGLVFESYKTVNSKINTKNLVREIQAANLAR